MQLKTNRLRLRQWQDDDYEWFATMNADSSVMKYFPATLSKSESNALADNQRLHIAKQGWGLWACDLIHTGEFIGFVGLARPKFKASFAPCVEIGWRLAAQYHRKGYASEAAKAVISYAFEVLKLPQLVSFTAEVNEPSIKLMQHLGLQFSGNFKHPELAPEHWLSPHVLYRLNQKNQE